MQPCANCIYLIKKLLCSLICNVCLALWAPEMKHALRRELNASWRCKKTNLHRVDRNKMHSNLTSINCDGYALRKISLRGDTHRWIDFAYTACQDQTRDWVCRRWRASLIVGLSTWNFCCSKREKCLPSFGRSSDWNFVIKECLQIGLLLGCCGWGVKGSNLFLICR